VNSAITAMGYIKVKGQGGSHINSIEGRTALPHGENTQPASMHGMKSAAAVKVKSRDWG
jgi:hypothetical protein